MQQQGEDEADQGEVQEYVEDSSSETDPLEGQSSEQAADQATDRLIAAINQVAEKMNNAAERVETALAASRVEPPNDIPDPPPLPDNNRDLDHEGAAAPAQQQPIPRLVQAQAVQAQATPATLRNDSDLMSRVARRLFELGEDQGDDSDQDRTGLSLLGRRGKKSGQARTVEDVVITEIDWPHLNVYRGPERRPVRFNELTVSEFIYGFLQMISIPRNHFNQDIMLNILKLMMEDTLNYPWESVRNFYRVLASSVEMNRIQWDDQVGIANLRYQFSHRLPSANRAMPNTSVRNTPRVAPPNTKTCHAYQRGECREAADHAGLAHACGYCFRTKGFLCAHPEKDCRRKMADSKNGQSGEQ